MQRSEKSLSKLNAEAGSKHQSVVRVRRTSRQPAASACALALCSACIERTFKIPVQSISRSRNSLGLESY